MLKLIKLEWKKNNVGKYFRYAVILTAILGVFIFAMAFLGITKDEATGIPDVAPGNNNITSIVEMFTSMSFLVFSCVMLSSFIVSAYKNKTMNLMFSYPVKRQKILISQMLAVWIFNFVGIVLAKLIIYGSIFLCSKSMKSDFPIDFNVFSVSFYIQLILKSMVIVTISFIALFIGLAMKSSKAAVISSFLLILLTQGNVGDFTLADNAVFPIVLVGISIFFGFLSVYHVEKKDLL